MYKLLLCWRYLLTRYLALACIVSVMLGVATLIVVNSVMSGFSTKLKERLHGLLSDLLVEATSWTASPIPKENETHPRIVGRQVHRGDDAHRRSLRHAAIPRSSGDTVTRPVRLVGIDPKGSAAVGGFGQYLVNQNGSPAPASFELGPQAPWRYRAEPSAAPADPGHAARAAFPASPPTRPAAQPAEAAARHHRRQRHRQLPRHAQHSARREAPGHLHAQPGR